ncbi:unnamed protein product, partial [Symbiodinium sp. CCMP2456]
TSTIQPSDADAALDDYEDMIATIKGCGRGQQSPRPERSGRGEGDQGLPGCMLAMLVSFLFAGMCPFAIAQFISPLWAAALLLRLSSQPACTTPRRVEKPPAIVPAPAASLPNLLTSRVRQEAASQAEGDALKRELADSQEELRALRRKYEASVAAEKERFQEDLKAELRRAGEAEAKLAMAENAKEEAGADGGSVSEGGAWPRRVGTWPSSAG